MGGSYQNLIVWQKAKRLAVLIYEITELFPKSEIYGLGSQMRRCAISIISNIAEGKRRASRKEYRQFLYIAYASTSELEAQTEVLKDLPFGVNLDIREVEELVDEVLKMLYKLIESIK